MSSCHEENHVIDPRVKRRLRLEGRSVPGTLTRRLMTARTKPKNLEDGDRDRDGGGLTSSRPGLCWTGPWTQSSWTCLCRSDHTDTGSPMPPCFLPPLWAEWRPELWPDLRGDSSCRGGKINNIRRRREKKKIRQEIKAEHRNGTDSGLRKRCYHWNESQWSAVEGNQEEKQQQESTQEEIWSNIYVHLLITDEEKQTNRRRRRDDQTLLYSSCDVYFLWFKTLI